jgi:uncharacterized spore protein YtfJ
MNREYLDVLLKEFGDMLTTESVFGQPIVIGKVTIVPIVTVSFAFGSGQGNRNDKPLATGTTAGAKLSPVGFLSVHEDGSVNLHHVRSAKDSNLMDRVIEMAPGLIDKISSSLGKRSQAAEKNSDSDDATLELDEELAEKIREDVVSAVTEVAKELI